MSLTRQPGLDSSRLRQQGLRVTGPRLAILATLTEIGGHRSADELVSALRDGGYHHARTTVYNALDDLSQAGLLRAAPVDSGALRYEPAGEDHHHFVCRQCGAIRNVAIDPGAAPPAIPPIEGALPDGVDVIYRGTCSFCAATSTAAVNHVGGQTEGRLVDFRNARPRAPEGAGGDPVGARSAPPRH